MTARHASAARTGVEVDGKRGPWNRHLTWVEQTTGDARRKIKLLQQGKQAQRREGSGLFTIYNGSCSALILAFIFYVAVDYLSAHYAISISLYHSIGSRGPAPDW